MFVYWMDGWMDRRPDGRTDKQIMKEDELGGRNRAILKRY